MPGSANGRSSITWTGAGFGWARTGASPGPRSTRTWPVRSKAGRGGDRRKKEPDPVPGNVGSEKDQADLRYRLAKAEKEEYLVKQLKGHVVAKEEIYPVWAARVAVVTDGLNALIDRLPPLLEGKSRAEIQDILRDEIWSIRDSYAREGEYCPQG